MEIVTRVTSDLFVSLVLYSSLFLTLGLLAGYVSRLRAARAFQVLFLCMLAAVWVAPAAWGVRQLQWGLFQAPSTTIESAAQILPAPELSKSASTARPSVTSVAGDTNAVAIAIPAMPDSNMSATISWRAVWVGLWLSAGLILALRLLVAFLFTRHLARQSQRIDSPDLQHAMEAARANLGITRPVHLYRHTAIRSCVIWCWGRDLCLLVSTHDDAKESVDWTGIFCHELAHYKRHDHVMGLLSELLACLLPWHPLIWMAKRRLVVLSEQACDDWVLASGHTATDYADSLFRFIPQRQIALIPAVATSQKGLTGRIMRIVEDKMGNPHLGKRWTVAMGLMVVLAGLSLALAQTRPNKPETQMPEDYHCKMHASIPCLHGKVTDPNGDHVTEVLVAVLPMTSCQARTQDDPYFDIPWDSSWAPDQPPQLIARHDERNLAALVTCTDPDTMIHMILQPAVRVTAKVLDPNGDPLQYAQAVVMWNHEIHGPLPIVAKEIRDDGLLKLGGIPTNLDCMLGIYTDELGIENLPIAGQDSHSIALGTLLLAPLEGKRLYHPKDADWQTSFNQMYSLSDHQDLKLIKPPFSMARQHYLHNEVAFVQAFPLIQRTFRWDGELRKKGGWYYSHSKPGNGFTHFAELAAGIRSYEYHIPDSIVNINLPTGDIICRDDISTERKLKALEQLIAQEVERDITFKKQAMLRDVLVVSGRYRFNPITDWYDMNDPVLPQIDTTDPHWLYLPAKSGDSCGTTSRNAWGVGGENIALSDLLEGLAHCLAMPVINQVDSKGILIERCRSGHLPHLRDAENVENLKNLLDLLSRQTNLSFEIHHQPFDTWVAVEH